jgi:hypothetical protein
MHHRSLDAKPHFGLTPRAALNRKFIRKHYWYIEGYNWLHEEIGLDPLS